MNKQSSKDNATIWHRLVENHKAFSLALKDFLSEGVDRVTLVRNALKGEDWLTAIYILAYLPVSELTQLFSELVFHASHAHGGIQSVRSAILSLPREWVLANIEEAAEPLLRDGTYDEYRRLLELYIDLDHDLALKLARRAMKHADYDIREAGEDFLKILSLPNDEKSEDNSERR